MRKTKSRSSYTNKWLNRHKSSWHEKIDCGCKIIFIDVNDAPKIVLHRVEEINRNRRGLKNCYIDYK